MPVLSFCARDHIGSVFFFPTSLDDSPLPPLQSSDAAALVTLSTKKSGWGFVFVILFIREHHDAGVTSSYLSLCVVECNAKGEKISRSEQ